MSRYQNRRARRSLAWTRRPSLAARVLGLSAPADAAPDNVVAPDAAALAAPVSEPLRDDEPPFDPPDADDEIFLGRIPEDDDALYDADDEFIAATPAEAPALLEETPPARRDLVVAQDQDEAFASEAPPLDEGPEQAIIEDPPFDAPDESDDVFGATFERVQTLESFAEAAQAAPAEAPCASDIAPDIDPAPPLHIHAFWDRPEIGKLLGDLDADARLKRADIEVSRGGIDGAIAHFSGQESPDLIIIDTDLSRTEMLAALDRLAHAVHHDCKILILGALNDIGLLRDLAARGVSDYLAPPHRAEDLARAICRLYAQADQSRVIAVIGARGGAGASTIAHNLAWSIAERQESCAGLIELDLAFGGAMFSIGEAEDEKAFADLLAAPDTMDGAAFARVAIQHTKHLQSIRAPATLERVLELAPQTAERLVRQARRANAYVVLDLPHAWRPWVKETLANADEIVLAACPDLASLRNVKSMLEALAPLRAGKSAPHIVLTMTGVPKRPEISAKDFADAVGAAPAAQIGFDPLLFGLCETKGQMLGEAEPDSKAAATIDALAAALTGRKPVMKKRAADTAILARDHSAHFAKSPKRGARDPQPPSANDNVLVLTRDTSISHLSAAYEADPESEYLAKAREAAQAELDAAAEGKPRGFGWGRLGLAAAAAGLALVNAAWRAQEPSALAPLPAAAQAAPAPSPSAQYASALLLLGENRARDAGPLLQAAAEAGFAPAQHRLAQMLQRGDGMRADAALARAWTERAAANGNVRAMHDLGVYYTQSSDPAHASAAFRWFRQGAAFGLKDSQYNLGVLYQEGRGVSADAGEALFWFYVAAAAGDAEASARAETLAAAASAGVAELAAARAQLFRPRAPNPGANL